MIDARDGVSQPGVGRLSRPEAEPWICQNSLDTPSYRSRFWGAERRQGEELSQESITLDPDGWLVRIESDTDEKKRRDALD